MPEGSEKFFGKGMAGEPVMGFGAEKEPQIIMVARNMRKELGLPDLPEGAKDAFEGLDDKQATQLQRGLENWQRGMEMMDGGF